ncbi:MAG: pantoate--beta-alanine ligase [Firmicutes bacterium]|nr:pantoate--beta-alanine ligase [Bacillota bacterium]
METIESILEMKAWSSTTKAQGKKIAFVPTMGYLHKGHLELIKKAKERCPRVVSSIFVNPKQFGPSEDYANYPRNLERDRELAEWAGTDVLFVPKAEEMYPEDYSTYVEVEELSDVLCGASREGHFKGVATVVMKLFNIVQPYEAFFGEKDAQQLIIIRKMIKDLNMDIKIISVPTIRETDGVALSSRNKYLNEEERKQAVCLYQSILRAKEMIDSGERSAEKIKAGMEKVIKEKPLAGIDYIEIVDASKLKKLDSISGRVLVALSVKIGKARLIDNIMVEV